MELDSSGAGLRQWRQVRCLSCSLGGASCQYVSAQFSRSSSYYVLGCLGPSTPTYRVRSILDDTGNHFIRYVSREAQPRRNCILVTAVCVSVCLSLAAFPHYCTDLDVTWGSGRGCPVVVHYWADLQSVHGVRGCDNVAPSAKCQRVLVLALSLVTFCVCRRRRKMYLGHARLCVCLSVRGRTPTLLHGPGCNLEAW